PQGLHLGLIRRRDTIMDSILLRGTERLPEVEFDFDGRHLAMRGEAYPEDSAAFFGPLVQSLREFLNGLGPAGDPVAFDLRLTYFNSSSAKALMNMFVALEAAAGKGVPVVINWQHHAEDEAIREFGEDFASELENATFNLQVVD